MHTQSSSMILIPNLRFLVSLPWLLIWVIIVLFAGFFAGAVVKRWCKLWRRICWCLWLNGRQPEWRNSGFDSGLCRAEVSSRLVSHGRVELGWTGCRTWLRFYTLELLKSCTEAFWALNMVHKLDSEAMCRTILSHSTRHQVTTWVTNNFCWWTVAEIAVCARHLQHKNNNSWVKLGDKRKIGV